MRVSNSALPVIQVDARKQRVADVDGQWWKAKDEEAHASVIAVVDSIASDQAWRELEDLRHARLYSNRQMLQLMPGYRARTSPTPASANRLRRNVVKSCVDTAAAMISTNRPNPKFLTSDGNGGLQRKAKWLTRYVEGVFYDGNAYSEAQRCFVDACVTGTGVVRAYWDEGPTGDMRLRFERAMPWEIYVDEEDGRDGKPKQLHHVRWVYADVLCQKFPAKAKQIRQAVTSPSASSTRVKQGDKVRVVESWHLRSGWSAKDGRHAIVIEGCTLLAEEWTLDSFPYAFFRWNDRQVGFWGCGLAEELVEIQAEINRTAQAIQAAQHLVANPRVYVEKGSHVNQAQLTNKPGGVVEYQGRPPTFATPVAMNGEAYSWLESCTRSAYEISGISQMQASAQKPGGLDSGVAIREYNDTAAVRFTKTSQRWEDLFMELARTTIAMSRQAYESGAKQLSVNASDGKFLRQVKWSEVSIDDDRFHMEVFPTSMLPTTPAGKLQTVQELVQAGLMRKEYAVSFLDFPDLEAFTSLETAAFEDVRWTIERILEHGEPQDVDEVTNLELAVTVGMSAVLRAKRDKEPEERQQLLREWVDRCKDAMNAQPPADVGPSGPANDNGGQPIAQPNAPPTSDLLPAVASDEGAKVNVHAINNDATRMMDAIGGGKSWRYKADVPGEDPSETHYGTTTQDLERTPMGATMVEHGTNSDGTPGKYDAISLKDSVGPILAALGTLNERLRAIEDHHTKKNAGG